MAKKTQIIIPNGRIIVKQEKKVQKGPMSMFVTSDDEKLLRFAKELSLEAAKESSQHAVERAEERHVSRRKKKRK